MDRHPDDDHVWNQVSINGDEVKDWPPVKQSEGNEGNGVPSVFVVLQEVDIVVGLQLLELGCLSIFALVHGLSFASLFSNLGDITEKP